MFNIKEDLRSAFRRPDNALVQLIIINVIVFVLMGILVILQNWFEAPIFTIIDNQFTIPASFDVFITRPWTIITYAFAHAGLWHILMNMLWLYWFGLLISEYLGSAKVVNLYVLGALAGAVAYLLIYNLVPFYANQSASGMVGASAAVNAVMVAAATLVPNYTFNLIFIGPVRIKYLVGFFVLLSLLGVSGPNAGGNIAHLGGAAVGYVYIRQLQSGTDIGLWIQRFLAFIKSFFVPQSKIHVSHRRSDNKSTKSKMTKTTEVKKAGTPQQEIDEILDKISERGYESLTKEEKQKLFEASRK